MDRSDTTEGLGNPGKTAESYFHPLFDVLFPDRTRQAIGVKAKPTSSAMKRQGHLGNPGLHLRQIIHLPYRPADFSLLNASLQSIGRELSAWKAIYVAKMRHYQ